MSLKMLMLLRRHDSLSFLSKTYIQVHVRVIERRELKYMANFRMHGNNFPAIFDEWRFEIFTGDARC